MADIDLRVRLDNVRLSWHNIAVPQIRKDDNGQNKPPQYNAEFIMEPNHPGWARYHQVVAIVAQTKWKDKAQPILQMLQGQSNKRKWGLGQEKIQKSTMLPYPSYVGMVFVGAASDRAPQIFDALGNLIPVENMEYQRIARSLYGGCRVNAVVKPWCWDNAKGGSGVSNDFLAIQFLADDTPFGEGQSDASDLMGATPAAQAPAVVPGATWTVPGMPPAPFPQPSAAPGFFK